MHKMKYSQEFFHKKGGKVVCDISLSCIFADCFPPFFSLQNLSTMLKSAQNGVADD